LFSFSEPPPFERELVDVYLDRDLSAAQVAFSEIMGEAFPIEAVYVTHDGHGRQQVYRDYFRCDVHFCADEGKFAFSSSILDKPLPQSDPESSRHFQQQCQLLIAKLTTQGHFVDDVRMLMLARPGFFPDIDYVAEKLAMSTRTLRRRLKEEGSNYRALLDEIRFGLAKEYLGKTNLTMEEVCGLLGYSEPGNFSHAFRRWSGQSPRDWRQQALASALTE
jgi:AraC-like DNA-binding protein